MLFETNIRLCRHDLMKLYSASHKEVCGILEQIFGKLGFTFYSCPIDVFYHFVRLSRTESDRETLNFKGYEKFIFLFLS